MARRRSAGMTMRMREVAVSGEVRAADVATPRTMRWMRCGRKTVVGSE